MMAMIIHSGRRLLTAMAFAITLPVGVLAQTPQAAVDELLAADRAFSSSSADTDLVSGLTAMFADDVVIPSPPGQFVEGKTAVVAMLRANADNARSRTTWTPVRGGVSADGQQGFTVGFMTLQRPDGAALHLKYLAYWVRHPDGWRVAAYKRTRAGESMPPLAPMAPALPAQLVAPSTDAAAVARHRDSLDQAERAFSDEARRTAGRLSILHDLAARRSVGTLALRGRVDIESRARIRFEVSNGTGVITRVRLVARTGRPC
jgi:ketosteroid isomerase-like protein